MGSLTSPLLEADIVMREIDRELARLQPIRLNTALCLLAVFGAGFAGQRDFAIWAATVAILNGAWWVQASGDVRQLQERLARMERL
jgi:hypothetical protein